MLPEMGTIRSSPRHGDEPLRLTQHQSHGAENICPLAEDAGPYGQLS